MLEGYKGHLELSDIAAGMEAASINARRLYGDACILLDAGSYPTATSLAILAIEESGKMSVLRGFAALDANTSPKSEWRRYRSHKAKNVLWIAGDLVKKGARVISDFVEAFDPDATHPEMLDNLKQLGFYSDCLEKGHWSQPEDVIDEKLAKSIVELADILTKRRNPVTEKELQLWVEIVVPRIRTPDAPAALLEWYEAMAEAGLTDKSMDEIRAFLK